MTELTDRGDIQALLAAYTIAGDRGRLAELAGTFASDGVLVTAGNADGPVTCTGPDDIVATLATARAGKNGPDRPPLFFRHHLTTSQIKVIGDEAEGRTYFTAYSEIGLDHIGVYVDRFSRSEGNWKIRHRRVLIDWVAPNAHTRTTRR